MQKARIYLALENFFTFDKLNGLPNSGRTGVGTPTFKSVSVGVQLNF